MEASEVPPIEWTTDQILTVLGIITQGVRNGIQEYMLTEYEGIGHLNDESVEGIQAACRRYTKRNLADGRFVVTRLHFTISPQNNVKDHFTISPQQNGKDYFTISPQKKRKYHFTISPQ